MVNGILADAGIDQSVCLNSTPLNLSGNPIGGTWNGPGVTSAGVFTPSTVGSFTLTYSVGTGNCQVSDNLVITVFPLPSVTVADATICAGESITLTAIGSGGTAPYSYSWSPSTGLSAITGASVTANPSTTLTYTVTITSANTCTSTDQATVTVTPLPVVDAGINQNICLDLQGPLVFEGTPAGGIWSGNPFITASGLFTPAEIGLFPCIYTVGDLTCAQSDTIDVLVAVCTGLSPTLHNESTFTLIYNPNNESLMLSGFTEGYDNLLLEIMDISGKVVSTYALMPSKEKNQSVSIGNLSGGIYIARVLNGANSNALKFIVFN